MATAEELYAAIHESLQKGESLCVATVISSSGSTPRESGAKMVIWRDGHTLGTVGGGQVEVRVTEAARDVFRTGKPVTLHCELRDSQSGDPGICGGNVDVFVEYAGSKPRLAIIGGGHVGRALSALASLAGFRTIVMDARDLDPRLFREPVEFVRLQEYGQLPLEYFDEQTFVVIVTPAHSGDEAALRALLDVPRAYLGMIGSRRKVALIFDHLRERGATDAALERVHAPIGLDIGAETPEEIAVSILAQIIRVRRGSGEDREARAMALS
jgi:xanthine dehydrogenase accessory factor